MVAAVNMYVSPYYHLNINGVIKEFLIHVKLDKHNGIYITIVCLFSEKHSQNNRVQSIIDEYWEHPSLPIFSYLESIKNILLCQVKDVSQNYPKLGSVSKY